MLPNKPFPLLVIGSALFAASCVTVYSQPGRAAGGHMPAMGTEMAQAGEPAAVPPGPEGTVAESTAAPEGEHVLRVEGGSACAHDGKCEKCNGSQGGGMGHGMMGHGMMGGGDPEKSGVTDHQRVVGHWGIEARSAGTFAVSPANLQADPRCAVPGSACSSVSMTSIGIRRWHTEHYAYSAGLTLGVGGGNTSGVGSWDTYVGVGPNFGAYFLMGQWKHLAISASPQLGFLYFAPSGSGNKTFNANVAGKLEAELQLGFMGLPGLAVGTDVGLGLNYSHTGNDSAGAGGYSVWNLGTTGTSSVWGLFSNAFVRFYL